MNKRSITQVEESVSIGDQWSPEEMHCGEPDEYQDLQPKKLTIRIREESDLPEIRKRLEKTMELIGNVEECGLHLVFEFYEKNGGFNFEDENALDLFQWWKDLFKYQNLYNHVTVLHIEAEKNNTLQSFVDALQELISRKVFLRLRRLEIVDKIVRSSNSNPKEPEKQITSTLGQLFYKDEDEPSVLELLPRLKELSLILEKPARLIKFEDIVIKDNAENWKLVDVFYHPGHPDVTPTAKLTSLTIHADFTSPIELFSLLNAISESEVKLKHLEVKHLGNSSWPNCVSLGTVKRLLSNTKIAHPTDLILPAIDDSLRVQIDSFLNKKLEKQRARFRTKVLELQKRNLSQEAIKKSLEFTFGKKLAHMFHNEYLTETRGMIGQMNPSFDVEVQDTILKNLTLSKNQKL